MTSKFEMVSRTGSFCSSDPYEELLVALRKPDLDQFQALLDLPDVDPNHMFPGDLHEATCLEIACKHNDSEEFIKALLDGKANPNSVNPTLKVAPIHVAAKTGNVKALELLVRHKDINVNVLNRLGDTALHVVAKELLPQLSKYDECFKLLITKSHININKSNRKGYTAIHFAARNGSASILSEILLHCGQRLDLDTYSNSEGKTARDEIIDKFPKLENLLPPRISVDTHIIDTTTLFNYLYHDETESFTKAVNRLLEEDPTSTMLNDNDGSYTFLQYACDKGMYDVAKCLIEKRVDPNLCHSAEKRAPVWFACYNGFHRILGLFTGEGVILDRVEAGQETILHAVIRGNKPRAYSCSNEATDYVKCLDMIIDHFHHLNVDVDAVDDIGNTALHYATKNKDEYAVITLLRNGAYIGVRNVFDDPPLININPETLETFLNDCLTTNKELPRDDNYEIIFNYEFLVQPNMDSHEKLTSKHVNVAMTDDSDDESVYPYVDPQASTPETDPLLYISQSRNLRHLLKHPMFTSFLYLKWHRIRCFFYVNLVFYVMFVALLTFYILFRYEAPLDNGDYSAAQLGINSSHVLDQSAQGKIVMEMVNDGDSKDAAMFIVWVVLTCFLIGLFLREIFQFAVSPKRYLHSLENYLELFLILVTSVILFYDIGSGPIRQHLSAIVILLSWAELVLLIGRHPLLSTNIEMLKRVSYNFLKFLAWYSILIVAFALSFYTLFRDYRPPEGEEGDNFFLNPGMSFLKTVVMLTGEFDATTIPFLSFPGTSHVVFVLFVFLIAIVLFNLLNGLAVSDTQAIKNDAELVGYVSRVRLIYYFENILLGNPLSCLAWARINRCCFCIPLLKCCPDHLFLGSLIRNVRLFPNNLPRKRIYVLPNQGTMVYYSSKKDRAKEQEAYDLSSSCISRIGNCGLCWLDSSIIKVALNVLDNRGKMPILETLKIRLEVMEQTIREKFRDYDERIESLVDSSRQANDSLCQILELLRKNQSQQ